MSQSALCVFCYALLILFSPILLIGLSVPGCLSPALTLARLWQLKEWRWDRLLEHLRTEGIVGPILGRVRPAVFVAWLLLLLLDHQSDTPLHTLMEWTLGILALFGVLSIAQILLGKQPRPLWTMKALVLVSTTLLLTLAVAFILAEPQLVGADQPVFLTLAVLPFLQPVLLAIAWIIFFPVDRLLKERIMKKARAFRALYPDLIVIGITGSVGKTTTKELLHHILAGRRPLTTPEHVNSEMGVSQWMLRELPAFMKTRAGESMPPVMIVEMGAYKRGEIELLSSIVKPSIGILTFIGSQHLALFGSMQNVQAAKREILTTLPKDGQAFLNADNELARALKTICPCPVTTVGTSGADLRAEDIEETPEGIRFTAGRTSFSLPLHGTHNVTNVLLAIAAAQHLGLDLTTIAKQLRTFSGPKRTFEVRREGDIAILDDTHNASAASFRAAIDWARMHPAKTKVLLTSGIIELGEEEDRTHRELGEHAAGIFQRVIFTHDGSSKAFGFGFGRSVEILGKDTPPVTGDALLVCVGRMSAGAVKRVLPHVRE